MGKVHGAAALSLGAITTTVMATACAHYYAPVTRLESPEASGTGHIGKIEIGSLAGTDLNEPITMVTPASDPSETPSEPYALMAKSWVNPFAGFTRAITDAFDLTLRVQPAAPLQLRAKYQFIGEPETRAEAGNFAGSLSASGGFLKGASVTSFAFDGSAPIGYRLFNRHLFSAHPFVSFTKIDGLSADTGAASGSVIQYGGGLGYQYSYENLYFRVEGYYGLGSSADNVVKGIFAGALLGVTL